MQTIGGWLAAYLTRPLTGGESMATSHVERLLQTLRPGDVLLVEGNSRISLAIKYITQSIWSHAAVYVGERDCDGKRQPCLIEADLVAGVRLVPVRHYAHAHTRICRAVGLDETALGLLVEYLLARLGHQYDLKNVLDLLRYTVQRPPVPRDWRRKLLAFGSGDPTKAICSTLIAGAFQSIRYPILPHIEPDPVCDVESRICVEEIWHIRHHSLYTPRDFDISPYFQIIKPTLEAGFDYRLSYWGE